MRTLVRVAGCMMLSAIAIAQVPTQGLVAYYPFDGNANDESGNGYNLTVHGPILSSDRFGRPNSAYEFNGSSDWIGGIATGLPTTDRTVSLWFYSYSLDPGRMLLAYGAGGPGQSFDMLLNNHEGVLNSYWVEAGNQVNAVWSAYSTPPVGAWYHWAVTANAVATNFYVNGVLVKSSPTVFTGTLVANKPLVFGCAIGPVNDVVPYVEGGAAQYWYGKIDDVRIYNRALSQSEIQQLLSPRIISVSPNVGKVGTPVVITGTGFSSTASSNTVYFGAVKATVTSATTTSLSVTVPPGATFEPVTVTVAGLTAYANSPFLITYDGPGVIGASSFAPEVDFATGEHFRWGTIADLDGDGKPDIAEPNDNNNVSIWRNTSVPGSITTSSFAAKIDFPVGVRPYTLAAGDLDGDGKLDLAVCCNTSAVMTTLRNTSSPGSLSFTRQDFTVPSVPGGLAIRDLDLDGKPDVVVSGSSVSIFRNTTTGSAVSFAPRVDLNIWGGLVTIADIDGDGRPDILVAKRVLPDVDGYLTVFRNVSVPGSIAFEAGVDFHVGRYSGAVAAGDLDGDGRPDVVITCGTESGVVPKLISVFRNTSSVGTIAFAPRIDFSSTDSTSWMVKLADLDGDGRLEIVAPIDGVPQGTVSVYHNQSTVGVMFFAQKVNFPTGLGPYDVLVGDLDLDGKPDMVTAQLYTNTGISILRNTIVQNTISATFRDTTAIVGKTVEIPVYVGDLTGKNVLAYQFTVTFNSPNNILTASSDLVTTGTLSGASGWSALPNVSVPNQITVGAFGANPLSGSGVLLKLKFTVNTSALTGQYSNLQFSNFLFNAGTPNASTTNGKITARLLVCGDADENGSIQAYDAALTLREAIGPMPPPPPPLTAQGRINADVDMNGYVQAYDAALILRKVIGLSMPVGVSTCFSGFSKGVALESGPVNFNVSVASVQRDKVRTSAELTFKGLTPDAGIVAISFDVAMAEGADNGTSLAISGLSEDYMHTINRVDNEHFKVGIINPHGIRTDDIRMTIGASREESLKDIRITNILLNSTPAADIALTGTVANVMPTAYDLVGCYPNPFNPSTTIRYGIPVDATVNLAVYNTLGQKVAQLVEEHMSAGYHDVVFDASQLASGIYYYRLQAADFVATKKLVLMR